jgi:hypothetical protein
VDALRFDVEQNEAADDILSRRVDRIERALHALLENPGGMFAATSAAREILNSEL